MKINLGSEFTAFKLVSRNGESSQSIIKSVAEGIQGRGFPDFVDNTQTTTLGWTSYDDFLDSKWEGSTIDKGPYVVFNLRVDSKKISGKAVKRLFAEYIKKNGPVKGKEKKEVKDNIKFRLMTNAPIVTQCTPVLIDTQTNELLFFSASAKMVEEFIVLFEASVPSVGLDYDTMYSNDIEPMKLLTRIWSDLSSGRTIDIRQEEETFSTYIGNMIVAEGADTKITFSGEGEVIEEVNKAIENGCLISKCEFVFTPSDDSRHSPSKVTIGISPNSLSKIKIVVSSSDEADENQDEMEAMFFEYAYVIFMTKELAKLFIKRFV